MHGIRIYYAAINYLSLERQQYRFSHHRQKRSELLYLCVNPENPVSFRVFISLQKYAAFFQMGQYYESVFNEILPALYYGNLLFIEFE